MSKELMIIEFDYTKDKELIDNLQKDLQSKGFKVGFTDLESK